MLNTYSAVIAYAHAFHSLYTSSTPASLNTDQPDDSMSLALKEKLLETKFVSIAGDDCAFKENGDRYAKYDIVLVTENGLKTIGVCKCSISIHIILHNKQPATVVT